MTEELRDLSAPDHNIQLHLLVESVIEHHKEETNQFINIWEELKRDDNLRLEASSLCVRPSLQKLEDGYELSVECDAPKDLVMWNLCLATAMAQLPPPSLYNRHSFQPSRRSATVIMGAASAVRIFAFVNPLVQKTNCTTIDISRMVFFNHHLRLEVDNEQLQQLMDSVLEHRRGELNLLLSHWEALKEDPSQRIFADCLAVNAREEVETEVVNPVYFIVYSPSPTDLALWTACVTSEFLKFQIPETSIKIRTNPLAHRLSLHAVEFGDAAAATIHDCTNFFESNCFEAVIFMPNDSAVVEFKSWLDFIRKVKPRTVGYHRHYIANEIQNFVFLLAGLVEEVIVEEYEDRKPILISTSDVRKILKGKCERVSVGGDVTTLSLTDIENFVKFFHYSGKKFYLEMRTDLVPMTVQIGEYCVEIIEGFWPEKNRIIIHHVDNIIADL